MLSCPRCPVVKCVRHRAYFSWVYYEVNVRVFTVRLLLMCLLYTFIFLITLANSGPVCSRHLFLLCFDASRTQRFAIETVGCRAATVSELSYIVVYLL